MAVGRIGEYRLGTNASWDEYVERLEMFCEANKIAKEEQKRAVLLSCCGEEAYGLIVILVEPSRPTAATYEEIKTAVRKHLHPRPSELYARFLFYKRNQAAEESVAHYVTALRKLAEHCGFGDEQLPLDIMMRDCFICGLQNEAVQQRLLAEYDLTFNVAYDKAATAEATAKQQRDIRMQGRDEAKDCQGMIQATRTKQDATAEGCSCYRCNGKHAPHLCSFRKAACFKCKRVGHIARACRSKDESTAARKTPEQKRKVEKSQGTFLASTDNQFTSNCKRMPNQFKSRPVTLALKDDVGKEVDRLVQQGVWSKVEGGQGCGSPRPGVVHRPAGQRRAPSQAPEPVEARLDEARSRSSLKCRLPRQAASYSQTTTTAAGQHGSSRRGKSGPSYPRPGRAAKINTR
ncbi:uncharacterized protein [Dermacentor andersoni]|uniref:uncharacterized protein n=1 Tax=Dermacentor andersoni TaxID=34620 RepID=UPI0021553765|nr:uncharacterized protein LOC126538806 [Dermacentor andersoni]